MCTAICQTSNLRSNPWHEPKAKSKPIQQLLRKPKKWKLKRTLDDFVKCLIIASSEHVYDYDLIILSMGLLASATLAKPAVDPALFPSASPFGFYPGSFSPAVAAAPFAATPLVNPLGAPLGSSPLAVSSSQRLDYFNQFNAAFTPTAPARILAATPFSAPGARLIQPTRFIVPGLQGPFFI
ncbi:uncharacterized protein LOC108113897 [Drosophila eugracilis]|uniref:uncharacterized protein LOC108113897 n=1 Tax=Drosophila eugracilis TaxID=29029 RepID=UPI0007E5E3B9|nr:uncharacterized protein LOC108113897 [Drosophila eugracilis]